MECTAWLRGSVADIHHHDSNQEPICYGPKQRHSRLRVIPYSRACATELNGCQSTGV